MAFLFQLVGLENSFSVLQLIRVKKRVKPAIYETICNKDLEFDEKTALLVILMQENLL